MNDTHRQLLEIWSSVPTSARRVLPDSYYEVGWGGIDFSHESPSFRGIEDGDLEGWMNAIFSRMESLNVPVAYGGYAEVRSCYQQSQHFDSPIGPRSVHLGVDLFVQAGVEIVAPWEGTVHSLQDNRNHLDYGPTIILQHSSKNLVWHTLYGHLSKDSLSSLSAGDRLESGQVFATLGNHLENGGWVPHLHFQIVLDMEHWQGDYPGVCTAAEQEGYLANCPDPALLLAPQVEKQL